MNTKALGKTGLKVSELGLGGTFYPIKVSDSMHEEIKKVTFRAIEMGINYIDTATYYYPGEKILGEIFEEMPKPLILSAKLDIQPDEFLKNDRNALTDWIEKSIGLLNREYIDILCIHEPDWSGHCDRQIEAVEFYRPLLDVIDNLKKQGIIKNTCIAGTESPKLVDMIKTGKFDMVMTVYNYSLLWREAELELLPLAKEQSMGIIIGSPLQSMALASRFCDQVLNFSPFANKQRTKQFKYLYEISDEYGVDLLELSLRFVISNPDISCVLMHPRSIEEVDKFISIIEKGPLQENILKHLKEVAEMVPFRPYKELFI